jgi:hypothetical protein
MPWQSEIAVNIPLHVAGLERMVNMLKEKVESVESKVWWIITGVGLSILLQILLRLIP